jgi:hypothetical protein
VTVGLVADGYVHASFFFGPGGHGKSHVIKHKLDQTIGVDRWQYSNSSMSPVALVNTLEEHPDRLHFFEDMEDVWKKADAQGILRSACGSPRGGPRIITWSRARQTRSFEFRGGIIIASNEPLTNSGAIGAIASRFAPIEFALTPDEIAASIRAIALTGMTLKDQYVHPDEAIEVAEFVIDQMHAGNANKVDLRTFCEHAIPRYVFYRQHPEQLHWKEMVRSILAGEAVVRSRAERLAEQRLIAVDCYRRGSNTKERLALWTQMTGLSKQAFYDRLTESGNSEIAN